jgi:hypothetical protein
MSSRASMAEPEIVVDHLSTHGPTVTHMRGTMLVNSRENLRELGLFERYVTKLPEAACEQLQQVLATNWVPVELALAHYLALDELMLDPQQIAEMGARSAERVKDTFMGAALRIARDAGADTYWMLLKQNPRIFDRMYQGGRVLVLQTGPKDVILENHGLPMASSRFFRGAYLAYMEAIGRAFAKVSFIKLVRPRNAHPHSIAVAGSWV